MRVYEALVPENAPAQKLEGYLSHAFPLLPAHVIRNALSKRDVKQSGVRCGRDSILLPGAKIQLYTAFEAALPIVYEDERILLVNKPAGISCDSDGRGGMTVLSLLQAYAGKAFRPRLCHRLDNQTSGLLLLAKDDESEEMLLAGFREHTFTKVYECLVRGQMRPEKATVKAYLVKDAARASVRVITHETPGAQNIETMYETIGFDGTLSRLRVTLLTGRTHQIRAHMAFLSHPVLGDDKYGDRALNKRMKTTALHLCAASLTLRLSGSLSYLDGRTFTITPPF